MPPTSGRVPPVTETIVGKFDIGGRSKVIWVFANWTTLAELRGTVRHEAAHLAFARTHPAVESAGHSGPSEDFALAFEGETEPGDG